MLLEIETERLAAEVRWEDSEGTGEKFPHVYGAVDVSAVISVHALST